MQAEPKPPFAVRICNWMVWSAAWLVPIPQRKDWRQEWQAEVWHRWRFYLDARLWGWPEALRLIRSCAGAFPDAGWHFASQDSVQIRLRECARSPWTCLVALASTLLLFIAFSGGMPATRALLSPAPFRDADRLTIISLRAAVGSHEHSLEADIVPVWRQQSQLLEDLAGFRLEPRVNTSLKSTKNLPPFVVRVDPRLLPMLGARPQLGSLPAKGALVLDEIAWRLFFHANPRAIGSVVTLADRKLPIAAVLPSAFHFLSRQPTVYWVDPQMTNARAVPPVMVAAYVKTRVGEEKLETELTELAQNSTYFFYGSRLRISYIQSTFFAPVRFFGPAVFLSGLLIAILCGVRKIRFWGISSAFFAAKAALALAALFVAGMELSRPESGLLLAWKDGGSGPTLDWLFLVGSLATFFWILADQRARCRVCLRLLSFPVRIGCPGCLLLEWSGTELLCTEGHGVLHVPHLAASWEDEADRWVSMDDSWRELFAPRK